MKVENIKLIKAPRSMVWEVTIDIVNWPQWTPTVTSIERLDHGEFAVGSSALIKQPGLAPARWTVTALEPGKSFTWTSRVWGIRMSGTHEMTSVESGTRSVLRIDAQGTLAVLWWPLLARPLRRSLERENSGLKAWCEERAAK